MILQKTKPIDLKEFAELLTKTPDPKLFFSEILLSGRPYRLKIESAQELLHLLLLVIPMRGLPSMASSQKSLHQNGMSESEFYETCLNYLSAHPFFEAKFKDAKKEGDAPVPLKIPKGKQDKFPFALIAFEESGNKVPRYMELSLGEKLASPTMLEFCLDKGKLADKTGKSTKTVIENILTEVLSSISTHPSKLMDPDSSGGYCRHASNVEANSWGQVPWAVHEFDFDIPLPEALTCGAGYHSWSKVVLALVEFNGVVAPVYKVLSDPQLRQTLKQLIESHCTINDEAHRAAVVKTLSKTIDTFQIQPSPSKLDLKQVFVGQFGSEKGSRLINVAMPAALFHEMNRALENQSSFLEGEHAAYIEQIVEALSQTKAELETTKEALKAAKAVKPKDNALVESLNLRIERLKKKSQGLASLSKSSDASFKSLPRRELGFGGSSPQNVASGLTKTHHRANLLINVPSIPSARREDASKRRAFYETSLLQTPRIRYPSEKLPWFLRDKAVGFKAKEAIRELTVSLALKSMGRIFELRDIVEDERDKAGSAHELANRLDAKKAGLSPEIEALLFEPSSDYAQRKQISVDLAARVGEHVLKALERGFKEPVSLDKKKEILSVIQTFCLQELV